MKLPLAVEQWRRLVEKDLLREWRGRVAWPTMLLLGTVLALVLAMQFDVPTEIRPRLSGGMLCVAVFFAATIGLERGSAGQQEECCWDALQLYPLSGATVFLAKTTHNFLAVSVLELVLVPALVVLADAPLLARPAALALVLLSSNLGFASVGTLLSALTQGARQRGGMLILLLLPLLAPVLLGTAEAIRLSAAAELSDAWWRWVQLLGAFAVLYLTLGLLAFETIVEE